MQEQCQGRVQGQCQGQEDNYKSFDKRCQGYSKRQKSRDQRQMTNGQWGMEGRGTFGSWCSMGGEQSARREGHHNHATIVHDHVFVTHTQPYLAHSP